MAVAGYGYWALVAMTSSQPVVSALGARLVAGWIPGMPQRRSGIRSMVLYRAAITFNNFIVYLAYNVDKVLIGRFWGAEVLGIIIKQRSAYVRLLRDTGLWSVGGRRTDG